MPTLDNTVVLTPDLTPDDAARELSLHPETVRDLLKSGALAGYKPGLRRWRIRRSDLEAFRQARMTGANLKTISQRDMAVK